MRPCVPRPTRSRLRHCRDRRAAGARRVAAPWPRDRPGGSRASRPSTARRPAVCTSAPSDPSSPARAASEATNSRSTRSPALVHTFVGVSRASRSTVAARRSSCTSVSSSTSATGAIARTHTAPIAPATPVTTETVVMPESCRAHAGAHVLIGGTSRAAAPGSPIAARSRRNRGCAAASCSSPARRQRESRVGDPPFVGGRMRGPMQRATHVHREVAAVGAQRDTRGRSSVRSTWARAMLTRCEPATTSRPPCAASTGVRHTPIVRPEQNIE